MPINTLIQSERYAESLDKFFVQKSVTGFFTDNALRTKFVGAKTVLIPDIDFVGLTDYDRDTGFARGAITLRNTSYTMAMDRARSLQIDREDLDETGVANLAGQILGEYVRTKVVPECDAYVLSKLAGLANIRSNIYTDAMSTPYATFNKLVYEVRDKAGFDEELVAFVDAKIYSLFSTSSEISRFITVSDFKQGDVNLKVKSIDGVTLIPVVSERMKTSFDFLTDSDGATGGFKPSTGARNVYMVVCPKSAAHLVRKTEKLRTFTPDQNLTADAYKFDYRIYYDVFVMKSKLDTIWAWVAPAVSISAQPQNANKTAGSISGSLSVTATSAGTLTYQWYEADDASGANAVKVSGATGSNMTIPTSLEAGEYFYFVKIYVDGVYSTASNVAKVTVTG